MTLHAISIPKWGLAMEEGTVTSWYVAEGATVAVGDDVADIESSKIANVIESQVAGTMRRHVAVEGDAKPVGSLIAVVSDAGESDAEVDAFVAEYESRFASEDHSAEKAPQPQTVVVGGRTIRFLHVPGGEGTPVVLVHGFGGDHLNWMFNQAALAEGRSVYALDLPGHGGSSKDVGPATLAFLADSVIGWMDSQNLATIHLVGHSMGAAVATCVAAAQPARVASLTAICGVGFGGDLNPDYVNGFVAAQKRKDLKPVAELLFANPELASREMLDDLIAYKRIDGVEPALRQLIGNALSDAAVAETAAALAGLSVPVLAIYGAADQVVRTPDAAQHVAGSVVIENAGHMPHLEAAATVNERILRFIAS